MTTRKTLLTIAALALLSGGCLPEKRVQWSPDGRWAALRSGNDLYLCDSQGKLTPRIADQVHAMAWLPDGRLLIGQSVEAKTWAEFAAAMTPERRAKVEAIIPSLKAEFLAHTGKWEDFKPQSVRELSTGEMVAAFVRLCETDEAELAPKLGDKWQEFKDLKVNIAKLYVGRVGDKGTVELGVPIAQSVDEFERPIVAPDGKYVAYVIGAAGEEEQHNLAFCGLREGAHPRVIAERVALVPAWTPDSRAVIYATTRVPAKNDDLRLGVLARRTVVDSDGRLLDKLPDAEELTGLVFQDETRAVCLPDGRILFASLDIRLPATKLDMPDRSSLFCLEPGRTAVVARLLPAQLEASLPDAAAVFEVSPDGRRVCIPGSHGAVAVVTLATGQVTTVVPTKEKGSLDAVPVWRNADELCCARPATEPGAPPQLVLFRVDDASATETRVLSADWPREVAAELLKEPTSQPTAQPTRE
jgi:hypothetical protein